MVKRLFIVLAVVLVAALGPVMVVRILNIGARGLHPGLANWMAGFIILVMAIFFLAFVIDIAKEIVLWIIKG